MVILLDSRVAAATAQPHSPSEHFTNVSCVNKIV